jgi:hypothetical protein
MARLIYVKGIAKEPKDHLFWYNRSYPERLLSWLGEIDQAMLDETAMSEVVFCEGNPQTNSDIQTTVH